MYHPLTFYYFNNTKGVNVQSQMSGGLNDANQNNRNNNLSRRSTHQRLDTSNSIEETPKDFLNKKKKTYRINKTNCGYLQTSSIQGNDKDSGEYSEEISSCSSRQSNSESCNDSHDAQKLDNSLTEDEETSELQRMHRSLDVCENAVIRKHEKSRRHTLNGIKHAQITSNKKNSANFKSVGKYSSKVSNFYKRNKNI